MSNPPQEVCNFEFVSKQELPDLGVISYLYKHKKHGCPILYLQTEDSHNAFSAIFRTTPIDDSGRSHMLEHLVLDGTEKYPVKDLFTELNKRSFSTFMNALTASQWTAFPFSTINKKDYFNCLDVYLDSVFHPKLSAINFMSECFHLEFEENDPNKPLINGGVVYNEMVGSFNSFSTRIRNQLLNFLFPDSPERFCSGGIPAHIAESKIEDLRDHHSRYYHPSNAIFYHYGDIPMEEVFAKVDEMISPFPVSSWRFDTKVFNQPRWTEPRRVEIEDAFDPMAKDKSKQYRVLITYLVSSWADVLANDDIDFLFDLLTATNSSPIYKAILKPGLAIKYFLNGFYDDTFNTFVTFGFEGIAEENVEKVISLVQETLVQVSNEGFDQDRIKAILQQNELHAHHLSNNVGLVCLQRVLTSSCFNVDPHEVLDCNIYINRIRSNLQQNPRYYEELISKVFLTNNHKLTMVVKPVEKFVENISLKIKENLEEKKKSLTQEQIDTIVKNYEILKAENDKPQPIECLPSIKKADIDVQGKFDALTSFDDNVALMVLPMNHMTAIYLRFKINFTHELMDYLIILALVIKSVGAGSKDEEQFDIYENLYCTGFSISIGQYPNLSDPNDCALSISFKTECLDKDVTEVFNILKMIIFEPHLDNVQRIQTLVTRRLASLGSLCQSRGDVLLSSVVPASFNNAAAINNILTGDYQIHFLNKLIAENNWQDVSDKLQIVYREIFLKSFVQGFIHTTYGDNPSIQEMKQLVAKLNDHEQVPTYGTPPYTKDLFANRENVFIDTETSTNFTCIFTQAPSYADPNSARYFVLEEIMGSEYLHQLVRVKLGAYGSFVVADNIKGLFSMRSFRDPNPAACLEAFQTVLDICKNEASIEDDMIDRAVVKVFSSFDQPIAPSSKGMTLFDGRTNELMQQRRDTVYNVTKAQLVEMATSLSQQKFHKGIYSNKTVVQPPDGFAILKLNE